MKRWLDVAVRLIGMALLVGLFARATDWAAVGEALGGARWSIFGLAICGQAVGFFFNGLGWRHLLRAAGVEVGLGEMVLHDLSAVFWSLLLPGGGGGEGGTGYGGAGTRGGGGGGATALLAARLINRGGACLLALALIPFAALPGAVAAATALALAGLVGVAAAGLAVLRFAPPFARRLGPLRRLLEEGEPPPAGAMLAAAALSIVAQLGFCGMYWACFAAIGHPLGFAQAAWLMALTSLALFLPVTFGGLGLRELTIGELSGLMVAPSAAAGASLLVAAAIYINVSIGGLVELWRATLGRRPGAPAPPAPGPGTPSSR